MNIYRASKGLPAVVWNDSLHSVAFPHSLDMADGDVPYGHEGIENRYDLIRRRLTGAYTYAENVAVNTLESLSSATDDAVA